MVLLSKWLMNMKWSVSGVETRRNGDVMGNGIAKVETTMKCEQGKKMTMGDGEMERGRGEA
jgi:hypothetical protein